MIAEERSFERAAPLGRSAQAAPVWEYAAQPLRAAATSPPHVVAMITIVRVSDIDVQHDGLRFSGPVFRA